MGLVIGSAVALILVVIAACVLTRLMKKKGGSAYYPLSNAIEVDPDADAEDV